MPLNKFFKGCLPGFDIISEWLLLVEKVYYSIQYNYISF